MISRQAFLLWFLPLAFGMLILLLWSFLVWWFGIPQWKLPSPLAILAATWEERILLAKAARSTFSAALLGFLLSASVGFLLALLLASSRWIRALLYPHILILQMIPVIILTPVCILWLGPGLPSILAVAFAVSFFPVVATATHGMISTDRNMVDLFRMLDARKWQELLWLRVPSALPHYLAGLRIAGSLAVIGAIAGEFLAGGASSGAGLGFLVILFFTQLKTPALFATGLVACLCGFFFVGLVWLAQYLILRRWHESVLPPEP